MDWKRKAADIYAVSFLVHGAPPTLTLGYNAEARARAKGDGADDGEARWNYAFWLQNEAWVLGGERDAKGRKLWDSWLSRDHDDERKLQKSLSLAARVAGASMTTAR